MILISKQETCVSYKVQMNTDVIMTKVLVFIVFSIEMSAPSMFFYDVNTIVLKKLLLVALKWTVLIGDGPEKNRYILNHLNSSCCDDHNYSLLIVTGIMPP